MKELLQQILLKLSELLLNQEQQLLIIANVQANERWIDQRTAMHMMMRGERQLLRYVKHGSLICKKIGQANVYLESSILKFINFKGRNKL